MNRYNVLFLFSDQHNAKCLSSAGHPTVRTPYLDGLAKEGAYFPRAYANNPICTPSRMCYLSGLYPSTHGYYGLYGVEPPEPMTNIFSWFQRHGYRTGAVGKLHTPRFWVERHCDYVYDEFIEYPKYLEGAGLYDHNDNRAFTGKRDGQVSKIPFDHSCEHALYQQTARFLKNEGEPADRNKPDAPFFGWVSFSRPHQPYVASEPYASMYNPETIDLPPSGDHPQDEADGKYRGLPEEELRRYLASYYGLITQIDASIGMILKTLDEMGYRDDTIVVYASDHGDYAGEHGRIEKKGGISHRAISNVPFIVRHPEDRFTTGRVDSIVESVDLFPSLCAMAGVPVPSTVQGRSFVPAMEDSSDTTDCRRSALTENPYRKAITTERYRYVANLEGESDELYDLEKDPWELNNLIDDPGLQEIVSELTRLLLRRVSSARKPRTTINGFWHQHAYDEDLRIDLSECGPTNEYW